VRTLFALFVVVLLASPSLVVPAIAQCNMMECCDPTTGVCCNNAGQCWKNGQLYHPPHRHKHAAAPKMSPVPKDKTQYLRYQ
jgi:hypothetical protein